jgi:hypothetical protein
MSHEITFTNGFAEEQRLLAAARPSDEELFMYYSAVIHL